MSKTSNLQKKIAMLRLELRMQQMVNQELMKEIIESNRVINLLESEVTRLQDRVQCCGYEDNCPEKLDVHFMRNFGEYLDQDPQEEEAEV